MINPSLSEIARLKSRTLSGSPAPSRSGEKTGKPPIPSNTLMTISAGAMFCIAFNKAVLVDRLRALPEIANIFISGICQIVCLSDVA
jgi:hypothetical protein